MGFVDDVRRAVIRIFQFLAPARRERQELPTTPLSRPLQDLLTRRYPHYRRLPAAVRAEFNRQLQVFMAEKPVTGVEARVTREIRLFTAASAVTLTAGWPGYTWDQVTEVLIYPKHFDEHYRFKELPCGDDRGGQGSVRAAGLAHPWGVVILARPELLRSFDARAGGYHVGIHEFAHLIDLARSQFDGVPSFLSDARVAEWNLILAREKERLLRDDSVLDPYGLSHPTEFFAVAVEAFYQKPEAVAASHRELYTFLSTYFQQDPAAWAQGTVPTSGSQARQHVAEP